MMQPLFLNERYLRSSLCDCESRVWSTAQALITHCLGILGYKYRLSQTVTPGREKPSYLCVPHDA